MTKIKYISIQGHPVTFKINEGDTMECYPNHAVKPCLPQDAFAMVEECQVCGRQF